MSGPQWFSRREDAELQESILHIKPLESKVQRDLDPKTMRAVDEVNKRLFSNETSLWNMWNKACIQFDPLSGLISLGSVQIQGKWWEGSPF